MRYKVLGVSRRVVAQEALPELVVQRGRAARRRQRVRDLLRLARAPQHRLARRAARRSGRLVTARQIYHEKHNL